MARAAVTLHVGLDTFRPLEGEFIDEHRIHREWYEVPDATAGRWPRPAGWWRWARRRSGCSRPPLAGGRRGRTDLYVTPPYRFEAVDALITNFHLPRSSLLLLVTAFVQDGMGDASAFEARDRLLRAYREALAKGYRFFSFGDAMLIL